MPLTEHSLEQGLFGGMQRFMRDGLAALTGGGGASLLDSGGAFIQFMLGVAGADGVAEAGAAGGELLERFGIRSGEIGGESAQWKRGHAGAAIHATAAGALFIVRDSVA